MRWSGHVACVGRGEVHAGVWWRDLREGDHMADPGVHSWEDNIKIGLKEMEWRVVGWISVAQDRDRWRAVVNAVLNLRVS